MGRLLQLVALVFVPCALIMGLTGQAAPNVELMMLAFGGTLFAIGWLLGGGKSKK